METIKLKKNLGSKRRFLEYLDYKSIGKREFARKSGLSHTILTSGDNFGTDKVDIIHSIYPDLNLEWLITGKGPMLRIVEGESSANARQVFEEPQAVYGKPHEIKPATCSACDEKERVIERLKSQLEEVRYHLADKDKQTESLERQIEGLKAGFENQIEDLKNNLERLIASKDEMLSMKDEAIKGREATLAAKDEIISIQSKRISELESHRETEDLKKILGPVERIGQESTSLTDIHPKDLFTKAKKGEYKV